MGTCSAFQWSHSLLTVYDSFLRKNKNKIKRKVVPKLKFIYQNPLYAKSLNDRLELILACSLILFQPKVPELPTIQNMKI